MVKKKVPLFTEEFLDELAEEINQLYGVAPLQEEMDSDKEGMNQANKLARKTKRAKQS